jgi:hypothetical protein
MILCRSRAWPVVSGALSRPVVSNKSTALEDEFAALLEWERHLEEGLTTIGLSTDQSQVPYIRDCTTGPEVWMALATIHKRNRRAARIGLKRQLYTYVHNIEKPICNYVNGITTLAAKLKAISIELTKTKVVDIIIYALHPGYKAIGATLMRSDNTLTVAAVTSILIEAKDQYMKTKGLIVALAAQTRNTGGSGPIVCSRCMRPGHIARDCNGKRVSRNAATPLSGNTPLPPMLRAAIANVPATHEEEVLHLF